MESGTEGAEPGQNIPYAGSRKSMQLKVRKGDDKSIAIMSGTGKEDPNLASPNARRDGPGRTSICAERGNPA